MECGNTKGECAVIIVSRDLCWSGFVIPTLVLRILNPLVDYKTTTHAKQDLAGF